jgi:hypothetical protein
VIETDDDRLVFFQSDDFAGSGHVTPDTGQPFDITLIYDAHPVDTRNFDNRFTDHRGAQPSGSGPRFRCRSSEMPKALAGHATVTVSGTNTEADGTTFNVFDIQHDGTGMATIIIKRIGA